MTLCVLDTRVAALTARIPEEYGSYLSIGKGWIPIVVELDRQLALIDPGYVVQQVKEKFGGLRYYCSLESDPIAETLISTAAEVCSRTCEDCGVPGRLRGGGWVHVACDACEER